jgi:5-methylthioadenosine/S-adenosylhomocysteine deaminase
MALVIRNIAFLVCNPEKIETGCDVLISGDRIVAIGTKLASPPDAEVIDASGCAVIPGLLNAHTHLYQNFMKGISPSVSLVPWCNEALFPSVGAIREAFASGDRRPAYLWSAAGAVEMIRGGVTACINMDVTDNAVMQAWQDLGLRGVMAYTLTNRWVPAELRYNELETLRQTLDFVQRWHQPGGLLQVFLAPSTPFLCNDDLLIWVRDKAEALNLGVQIHVAEIAAEVSDSMKDFGLSPVLRLDRLGLLSPRLSAVHCVHVDQAEIEVLAQRGVQVVHCPKSNMKLSDGASPVSVMLAAGIPVGLGTDGCASNDLLDMWEEMRAALLLARVTTGEAAALTCADVFRMATVGSASAFHLQAGKIEPGWLADLVVIELRVAHLRPLHPDHLIDTLVLCAKANDVRDTIINGQVVMRQRKLTRGDEEALLGEADEIAARLYQRRGAFPLTAEM